MDYQVVYDASTAGFHTWPLTLTGLLMAALGGLIFVVYRRSEAVRDRVFGRLAGPVLVVAGIGWTCAAFLGARAEYDALLAGLLARTYVTVEGVVQDFVSEGPGGRPAESWSINGHRYSISRSQVTSGFGQPGIVQAGQRVRLADIGGVIARLEVARQERQRR